MDQQIELKEPKQFEIKLLSKLSQTHFFFSRLLISKKLIKLHNKENSTKVRLYFTLKKITPFMNDEGYIKMPIFDALKGWSYYISFIHEYSHILISEDPSYSLLKEENKKWIKNNKDGDINYSPIEHLAHKQSLVFNKVISKNVTNQVTIRQFDVLIGKITELFSYGVQIGENYEKREKDC